MKQTFKSHMVMIAVLFTLLSAPLLATPARAEGTTLALAAADQSIYYGQGSSTDLSATLQLAGQPVQGALVRFALLGGGGTLSAGEATTDETGLARVTYTAPASLEGGRVVLVQASYTSAEHITVSAPTTIFLGTAAQLNGLETIQTQPGRQLLSPAGMGIAVTKRGTGTPIVSLGSFGADPYQTSCKAEPGSPDVGTALTCLKGRPAPFTPDTPFLLARLSSAENVDSLQVRISYRRERHERSLRLFWHSATGWRPVEGARVNTTTNEVTFLVTAKSTPSLRQLRSGQPGFVVAH